MHVDLVEALRCPRGHEESWLVAATDVVIERRIIRGTIGCPVCGAEWRIEEGELDFDAAALLLAGTSPAASPAASPDASPDASPTRQPLSLNPAGGSVATAEPTTPALEASGLRMAALLDLRDTTGAVVLFGEAARVADALASLTGVLGLAVNAPPGVGTRHSRLRVLRALPLGVGTVRGAALDHAHAGASWIASAVRAVQQGGRIIAPADVPVPDDVRELARDEDEWVGEVRVAASGLVPLRRGGDPLSL